ncbi:hypothetical protein [Nonomuraea sp. NPDC003804]|uniref:SCO7613 C-terminal domain-containing membrane protein n=1 Tax=Nonomuraea sp. NPDC003804 TaxID=3154547 RepID=UPI0033BA62A2
MHVNCPDCGLPLHGPVTACPRCALPLAGPVAVELWQVDGALAGLRAREAELNARRAHLLSLLRADRARFQGQAERPAPGVAPQGVDPGPAGPVAGGRAQGAAAGGGVGGWAQGAAAGSGAGGGPGGWVPGGAGAGGPGQAARPEVSKRTAQNVLLILGGLMLAVAAIVFTVVSWGHLGIGGRAVILAGLTGVTLAVPALLLRRGLNATAETIGVLGLALMLLDGYAARRVGLVGGLDGWDYTAATLAVVAAAAAGYSRVLPLRVPMPLAVVLLQAPLPLLSIGHGGGWTSGALAATVALDAAIWTSAARGRAARVTATVCLAVMGTVTLMWAGLASFATHGPWHAAGLVVLAAVGGYVAFRSDEAVGRGVAAVGSATAFVVAAGALLIGPLPSAWRVVPYTVAALAVATAARWLPVRLRAPFAYAGVGLALASAVPVVPQALLALLQAPVMGDESFRLGTLVMVRSAPVVFVLLAAVPLIVGRARWMAPVSVVAAVLVAPVAYGLPYTAVVAVQLVVAVGCTLAAALLGTERTAARAEGTERAAARAEGSGGVPVAGGSRARMAEILGGAAPWAWTAGVSGGLAVLWSLNERAVAYVVLGVLLVAWGALYRRPAALVGASFAGTGLVWLALDGLGVFPRDAAATGLAVGAALALLGWYGTRGAPPALGSAPSQSSSASPPQGPVALAGAGTQGGDSGGALGSGPLGEGTDRPGPGQVGGSPGVMPGAGHPGPVGSGGGTGVLPGGGRPGVLGGGGTSAGGTLLGSAGRDGSWAAFTGRVTAVLMAVAAVLIVGDVLVGTLGAYLPVVDAWSGAPAFAGGRPLALVAVGVAGAVAALATRPAFGVPAGAVALAVVPVTVRVPYPVVLVLLVLGAAAAAAVAARGPGHAVVRRGSAGAALWLGSLALGWALAVQAATLAVLPALAAVAALTGLLWADVRGRGGVAGGTGQARFGWTVLSGALVAGEVVAVAAAFEVRVVEAYTLPFAVLLLVAGWWGARGRALSSWPVYGPGLALAFGPSLVQAATPLRALLLGTAALAVTLAGARWRLQAPTVMGALTVAVVAVRELAPWIADLFGVVPRWVPMALGGLLLVVVGATYEARKRDVRRLRDAVARLR